MVLFTTIVLWCPKVTIYSLSQAKYIFIVSLMNGDSTLQQNYHYALFSIVMYKKYNV